MRLKEPGAARPATITDVARAAGVSKTTVSFVLNDTANHTISPETRERIRKAARTLGYRPNASARALSKGHSDGIAWFMINPTLSPEITEWITSARERARDLGYMLETHLYFDVPRLSWKGILEGVLARHPAGIVAGANDISRADHRLAQKMGVRGCALIGPRPVGYAPTVLLPIEQAAYMAGIHFREQGHTRVAIVAPRSTTQLRQEGYEQSLRGLQAALDGTLQSPVTELVMQATYEDARAAVETLLHSADRPTAIYGYRDEFCFPLLKALLECGLRVPEDIALVGRDDSPFCSLVSPSLTSIRFDIRTLAVHTVDVIDCLVHDRTPPPELLVPPPPQLLVRASG